jgi:hypothetical protein
MIDYTECPYCEKETEISYEGIEQNTDFECNCDHCNKVFVCYYELSIEFYPSKGEIDISGEHKEDDKI